MKITNGSAILVVQESQNSAAGHLTVVGHGTEPGSLVVVDVVVKLAHDRLHRLAGCLKPPAQLEDYEPAPNLLRAFPRIKFLTSEQRRNV